MAMTTATAAGGKVFQPREALSLLLLLVLAAGLGGGGAVEAQQEQQACAGQLNGLASCARYSVPPLPGQAAPAPGAECCSALGAVSRDCACETFGIINSLPAKCGLAPVRCQ